MLTEGISKFMWSLDLEFLSLWEKKKSGNH